MEEDKPDVVQTGVDEAEDEQGGVLPAGGGG